MAMAKVELELGAPGTSRVVVDGINLAGVVTAVSLDADARRLPTVRMEIIGHAVMKAEAEVRLYISGAGLHALLKKFGARHGERCHSGAQGCVCGLDELLVLERVFLS